jgi:hypothetical protein
MSVTGTSYPKIAYENRKKVGTEKIMDLDF